MTCICMCMPYVKQSTGHTYTGHTDRENTPDTGTNTTTNVYRASNGTTTLSRSRRRRPQAAAQRCASALEPAARQRNRPPPRENDSYRGSSRLKGGSAAICDRMIHPAFPTRVLWRSHSTINRVFRMCSPAYDMGTCIF